MDFINHFHLNIEINASNLQSSCTCTLPALDKAPHSSSFQFSITTSFVIALPYLHPSPPLVQKLQQSVPSPDSWTIKTGREIGSVTVPSTVMGAKGTREAGRRHQNSTMMEVEAMIEEVAVTGEEGISGRLNNFVEDRSGELEEGRISNDDCAISKATKAGGDGQRPDVALAGEAQPEALTSPWLEVWSASGDDQMFC
jgi:hypothetical protein